MLLEGKFKVAAVQAAPAFYDLDACIDKAEALVDQARQEGCSLIAFGEAWFPGYPFHIWLGSPAWGMQFVHRYHANALERGTRQFDRLCSMARKAGIHISAGNAERDGGSLYLAQSLIGPDGSLLNHRRKLRPTHVERSVFGEGYGNDLAVTETAIGNVGQLCCWEHIQPLSKYAMYAQREQIHVSAWPAFVVYRENAYALGAEVNMAATRVYAVEGQCFAIAATSVITEEALEFFKVGSEVPPLIERGGGSSMIFGPDGRTLADFLDEREEGLVIAEIDLSQIVLAKAVADPAGHYAKPESTRLIHVREAAPPVVHVAPSSLAEPSAEEGPEAMAENPS